jgi:hypothetical protein
MKKNYLFTCCAVLAIAILVISGFNKKEWQPLFDGKTLKGWKAGENPSSFRVEDGMIVCEGPRAHLFFEGNGKNQIFRNFELKADVKTADGANSGIYFHTEFQQEGWPSKGYEVQVYNSDKGRERRKTGSLYAVRDVYKSLAKDNEWFNLHVIVRGNNVVVHVDGKKVVDYNQSDNPARESSFAGRLLKEGTFALQCHDPQSKVYYKNILVKRLPDKQEVKPTKTYFTQEKQRKVDLLINKGYPLIDFHVHLKGGLTLDQVLQKSYATGIYCGISPNCGIGFEIDTNEKLEAYYAANQNVPIFLAMQAEGREWVNIFKKESIAKYDYVFTDAMTFTNNNGKRMRLWINEEVEVGDPQDFMDMYVDRIVNVLNNEKIDIYVNATFLPEEIENRYNELWTESRMQKVVDALASNGIALEISDRYKIPNAAMVRMAKAKGVKFTFGTNNVDGDHYADLDYCIQMIEECGIQPSDMFMPKPDGSKPIQIKGVM